MWSSVSKPAVVGFRDLNAKALVKGDEEIEKIERVDVQRLTKVGAWDECGRIGLRRDSSQAFDDGGADVVFAHSSSGF